MEIAAGPLRSRSPSKLKQPMTPLEKIQNEFKRNPNGMHTCTRFEHFFSKENSPPKKRASRLGNPSDIETQLETIKDDETAKANHQNSREKRKKYVKTVANNSRESTTVPVKQRQPIFGPSVNQQQLQSRTGG